MSAGKADLTVVSLNEEKIAFDQHADEKFDDEPGTIAPKYRGTVADRRDMSIMGKKQVLRVRTCPAV